MPAKKTDSSIRGQCAKPSVRSSCASCELLSRSRFRPTLAATGRCLVWAQWVDPVRGRRRGRDRAGGVRQLRDQRRLGYRGGLEPRRFAEENREDTILVQQQQAPHVVKLGSSQSPAAGVHAAVVGYMTHQINIGSMDGPIRSSSCVARGRHEQPAALPLPGHRLRPAGDLSLLRGGPARLTRGHLLPARGAAGAQHERAGQPALHLGPSRLPLKPAVPGPATC